MTTMKPPIRKLVLTSHVIVSVGWLGTVLAYLALAMTGLVTAQGETSRSVYTSMELIGWYVIVPCSAAALLTGVVQSLGTEWGLFRHYWIAAKLGLTVVGTLVLVMHMPKVTQMAQVAVDGTRARGDFHRWQIPLLVHAVGGLLVLVTATVLSIYKPWGKTSLGRKAGAPPDA